MPTQAKLNKERIEPSDDPVAMPAPIIEHRTLETVFGLKGGKAAYLKVPVIINPGLHCPLMDPFYEFQEDLLRQMLLWLNGTGGKNLLAHGPTGCGKSSGFKELAARMGREVFEGTMHARFEWSELVGQNRLTEGSTRFVYGPLPLAMKTGGILLVDEVNFTPPGQIGAMNRILDGGPLEIPETGELIAPHPAFRVAATANAIDRDDDAVHYRGTTSMNLAFVQRFNGARVDYLTKTAEAALLHRALPSLPGKVIEIMVAVAHDIRTSFVKGDLETTIATRILRRWGEVLVARLEPLLQSPEAEMVWALTFVLTNLVKRADGEVCVGVLKRLAAGLTLTRSSASRDGAAATPA